MTDKIEKTESAIVTKVKDFGSKVWEKIRYAGLYLKYRAKLIHFSKYHFKLWLARLWLNFNFVLQGMIALVTFNFIEPNLTHRASGKVALRKSDAHDYQELQNEKKALEKQKADGEEVDESKLNELNAKQETFDDIDAEMEAWSAKFAKKKKYDERGHLIKE